MHDAGRQRDAPGDSGSFEYVGPARPIDPARRRAKPAPEPAEEAAGEGPPEDPGAPAEPPVKPAPPAGDPDRRLPARPARRPRPASVIGAVDRVSNVAFPVVLRGYDRAAVDAYVAEVAQLVAELEATHLPEAAIQRALDEVGDETSEILKRAHATAEEVTTRARSEAAARLQQAEREADAIRREADDQIRTLDDDLGAIWQERQRLIEDLRQLAEDVLALADDALERGAPPGAGQEETQTLEEPPDEAAGERPG